MLTVTKVVNKKDLHEFIMFPWKIYKNDPYWVPPLINEIRDTLTPGKNPFWEHAQRELYVVKQNNEVVGRIAAIIDDNHNSFHNETTGFFGFFECIEDYTVAELLFNAAKEWVKEKGMSILRGPANPSMNDEVGWILEGYDSSPTIMMPYNKRYYLDYAERYGFKKAKDLYAFIKRREDTMPERLIRIVEKVKQEGGLTVRPIDMHHLDRDIRIIKDIYNSAWEKNWGFVPMTEKEADLFAKKLRPFVIPELILIAEVKGKPVGVILTVPDINQVLKRLNGRLGIVGMLKFIYYKNKINGLRTMVGGVLKEYRNTGVIAALYYETEINARKIKRIQWCELGWNLEDNDLINRFDEAIGGKIYKKYRIYEMRI